MSVTHPSASMPSSMQRKLRSIRRRATVLAATRALAFGAAALLLAMVVAMSVDWAFTLFDSGIRTALTTLSLLLAAGVLIGTAARPLYDAFRWTRLASHTDAQIPQLEERWTTIASIAESNHQPTSPMARAMLQQVASEAAAMDRLVLPNRVVRPAALRPALATVAASALLFAGFLSLNWPQTSVLLQRFWSPAADITATRLASLSGDIQIPRGEAIELVAASTGLARSAATLELARGDEIRDLVILKPDTDTPHRFRHRLRADESFRYQVRSGDGRTPWHTVTVIDYPALADVRLTVVAPEYVDQPKLEKSIIPQRLKVLQGSWLELSLKPAEPVERLELRLITPGKDRDAKPRERTVALTAMADGWYHFRTQLAEDLAFSPHLWNVHGLTNEDAPICRVQVVEDKAPVARIISPNDEMSVAIDDVIDIKFEAHDDHGIASAELIVYDESGVEDGEEPRVLSVQPIPLGDKTLDKHLMGETQLDLTKLDLAEGAKISYAIRVSDNREIQLDAAILAQNRQAPADTATEPSDAATTDAKPTSTGETAERGDADPASLENLLADAGNPLARPREDSATDRSATAADQDDSPSSSDRAATDHRNPQTPAGENDAPGEASSERPAMPVDDAPQETGGDPPQKRDGRRSSSKESDSEPAEDNQRTVNVDDQKASVNDQKANSNDQKANSNEANGNDTRPGDDNPAEPPKSETPREPSPTALADAGSDSPSPMTEAKNSTPPTAEADNPQTESPTDLQARTGTTTDAPKDENESAPPSPQPAADRQTASAENPAEQDPSKVEGDPPAAPGDNRPEQGSDDPPVTIAQAERNARAPQNDPSAAAAADPSAPNESQPNPTPANPPNDRNSPSRNGEPQPGSQELPPPSRPVNLTAQASETGQDTETNRRRLKITARLTAVAAALERKDERNGIRERVVMIDQMLSESESGLRRLVQREIPDSDRSAQFRQLDTHLGSIELEIADLRKETTDHQFVFVGLQMVDIGRAHVTPARDEVFVGIRDSFGSQNATAALDHVLRAREMLAALLKRYDRVAREQALAESIDETYELYEVYVEKSHRLMREARQNQNPLDRKMGIIEVDQDYLDRYAEVLTLRREMLAEFARMLGDDPRLLSRYLDLVKRRQNSLRDQLSELAERQDDAAVELSGWRHVSDAQRDALWMIVAEMRLHAAGPLAKDAAELLERIDQMIPLELDKDQGTARLVMEHAKEIARTARQITFDVEAYIQQTDPATKTVDLRTNAEQLAILFSELDAALDQLNLEHEAVPEVAEFVTNRLRESRAVANQADEWRQVARHLEQQTYSGLAEVDQQKLALATEFLRIDMLGIEDDLAGQFQQVAESEVPGEILDMIRQLHRVMEGITHLQAAATFALTTDRLDLAETRQAEILEQFTLAEDLFDQIRRAVVQALDEYDLRDPNIADLRDPTLDEFLAQLEREPNIEAQLGIPNRPTNLRTMADIMTWQQSGGDMLGDAEAAAARRAREEMKNVERAAAGGEQTDQPPPEELTPEQREQLAKQQQQQELLEKSLAAVKEKLDDPQTSASQRRQLEELAENMQRVLEAGGERSAEQTEWERIVEAEKAEAILKALAKGEALPDEQWNKLLSTLDDGLWQVKGRTPPEDYRKEIERYQDRLRQLLNTSGVQ